MEYDMEIVNLLLDDVLVASHFLVDFAYLLLNNVFIDWGKCDCRYTNKDVCKFLVTDFYKILCYKQARYYEELKDYDRNAEDHLLIQTKIKKITEVGLLLHKKEYHETIIYYMDILS
jgi:hypothetical protein